MKETENEMIVWVVNYSVKILSSNTHVCWYRDSMTFNIRG